MACGGGAAGTVDDRDPEPSLDPGLLIVGIDGASWEVIDRLEEEGWSLPSYRRLRTKGAWGDLATLTPTLSPAIWTTIATGKAPEVHGIRGFVMQQVMDRPLGVEAGPVHRPLVTGAQRRARALWELSSERGIGTTVLGWWMTWPAEPVSGVMISDRYLEKELPLRIHPPRELERLDAMWGEVDPVDFGASADPEDVRILQKWFRNDRYLTRVALDEMDRGRSAVMVYLRGTDPVSHRFWKYWRAEEYGLESEAGADLREVLPRYYRFVDERLGELLTRAADRVVIVVSDHGMEGIAGTAALIDPVRVLARLGRPIDEFRVTGNFLSPGSRVVIEGPELDALAGELRGFRARGGEDPLFAGVEIRDSTLVLEVNRTLPRGTEVEWEGGAATVAELSTSPPPGVHTGVHEAAPPGIVALLGQDVASGRNLKGASVFDVAPTALRALGVPGARDLPGRVLAEAWDRLPPDPGEVETHDPEARRAEPPPVVPDDRERLEELRTLGYIE